MKLLISEAGKVLGRAMDEYDGPMKNIVSPDDFDLERIGDYVLSEDGTTVYLPERDIIPRDEFLDMLSMEEMSAIYRLAESDVVTRVFKDLLLTRNALRKEKVAEGLAYLSTKTVDGNAVITEERKAELLEW